MTRFIDYKVEYLNFLRNYSEYKYEDSLNYEKFEYKNDNSIYKKIINKFSLDKLVNHKNEIETIISLMKWVNNTFIYDWNKWYFWDRNIFDLYNYSIEQKEWINCRMMSTILKDIYLSFGFKSRIVACLPIWLDYRDCHVVTIVFSNTLNKWIFMDSSWGIYIMNNDIIISLEEFRKIIINWEEIIFSSDNKYPYWKDEYIAYMTKNLFCFSSNINSEFNEESNNTERRVYLLSPENYLPLWYKNIIDFNNNKLITQYISNPDFFWEKP